jgi:hypothetical protein
VWTLRGCDRVEFDNVKVLPADGGPAAGAGPVEIRDCREVIGKPILVRRP